jgi:hypothetical protein
MKCKELLVEKGDMLLRHRIYANGDIIELFTNTYIGNVLKDECIEGVSRLYFSHLQTLYHKYFK